MPGSKQLVPEHVCDGDLRNYYSKEFRPLVGDGGDDSAAITTSRDESMVGVSQAFRLEVLSSGDKVVKAILPLLLPPSLVPFLALISAAPDAWVREDGIEVLHEDELCLA
jgi:hypothetical protein